MRAVLGSVLNRVDGRLAYAVIPILVLVAGLAAPSSATPPFVNEAADASANNVGFGTSIKVDAQGDPHIGYFDQSAARLLYARKRAGAWTREGTDPGAAGDYPSLALDSQGNPAISYFTGVTNDLKFARKSGGGVDRRDGRRRRRGAGRILHRARVRRSG